MRALSIPPKNMLMLAALGIGAYWLATRKARAGQASALGASRGFFYSPARASVSPGAQPTLGSNSLFSALGGLLGGVVRSAPGMGGTTEINNTATPGAAGWGWQYYSDGVAISPDGTYYKNGQEVWTPGSSSSDGVAVNPANGYSTAGASGSWDPTEINGMY